MKRQLGRELDKVELEEIKQLPILDLLLELKNVILTALQIISIISVFFSRERKEKIKVAIQRLKEEDNR